MGNCGSTSVDHQPQNAHSANDNYSPLTEDEIKKRIDASEKTEVAKFLVDNNNPDAGSFSFRFAFVSQKGYYPNRE